MADKIVQVRGREILNAKGMPTVEAEVRTARGCAGVASVPSGTSRGKYEAFELYDGGARFGGRGVLRAVAHVNGPIAEALAGRDIADLRAVDNAMIALDGTDNKSNLGANAMLAVSAAVAKAAAQSAGLPLYRWLGAGSPARLPAIVATVISGGVYSPSGLEFEDYMLVLDGFDDFGAALEALVAIRYRLQASLEQRFGSVPEDGGALAAPLASTEEAFDCMLEAVGQAGHEGHVRLGLDVAAGELYRPDTGSYRLGKKEMAPAELSARYETLCRQYPLVFLEDPFDQDAFEDFHALKRRLDGVMIVGDDLIASNPARLARCIQSDSANAVLLKINQIGTVSEALRVDEMAKEHGYDVVVSLRSGETNDDFIADLAVGIGAGHIKLGSPVRSERNAKYNRLWAISRQQAQEG